MTKPARLAAGIGFAALVSAGAAALTGGLARWLAIWIAASCAVVALAYARNRPGVFGKRAGRLRPSRAIALLPYLTALRIACWIMRSWRQTPVVSRVLPDLWVGGRVGPGDLPPGIDAVLDLTCEFSAHPAVRRLPMYRSFPVLDGSCPDDEDTFLALLDELARHPGGVLVHCESGRGRAPTAAVLLLLCRGQAAHADEAIEIVRRGRPWTKLTITDRRFIARIAARRAGGAAGSERALRRTA